MVALGNFNLLFTSELEKPGVKTQGCKVDHVSILQYPFTTSVSPNPLEHQITYFICKLNLYAGIRSLESTSNAN
jgi:hypothetical protein